MPCEQDPPDEASSRRRDEEVILYFRVRSPSSGKAIDRLKWIRLDAKANEKSRGQATFVYDVAYVFPFLTGNLCLFVDKLYLLAWLSCSG